MSETHAPRWERRPEERPSELLDAAVRVLLARGYRGTRLEEVAEVAGVSKATVYYYFRGKDDLLYQAAMGRFQQMFGEDEAAVDAEGGPVTARLRLLLRRTWGHALEAETAQGLRMILGELAGLAPELVRTLARESVMRRWAYVERLVEEGKATGEVRPGVDAKVAARLIVSALFHMAMLHVHLGLNALDPIAPDRLFDSAVDVWMHGLVPSPSASVR